MVQHRAAACQPRHALFVENVNAFATETSTWHTSTASGTWRVLKGPNPLTCRNAVVAGAAEPLRANYRSRSVPPRAHYAAVTCFDARTRCQLWLSVAAFSPTCAGTQLDAQHKDEHFTRFIGYGWRERDRPADWAAGQAPTPCEQTDAARCARFTGMSR